jgi:hypothetical protein
MYSTCLHCHRSLGANEAIEHFPIGRRLAFDSAKGRLWVICPHCGRWNLTPIEDRWEALEESEKLFRAQKLREQTNNIGLTRIKEGTELIRIGAPLRPEFAAWRYGAVFRRRLAKRAGLVAGAVGSFVAVGILSEGAPITTALAPVAMIPVIHSLMIWVFARSHSTALGTRVIGQDGKRLDVTRGNLEHTQLVAEDDGFIRLRLRHSYGRQELSGDRARRALASLLARVNRGGALGSTVREASEFIADSGTPSRALAAIAREAERRVGDFEERAAEIARGPRGRTIGEALDDQLRIQSNNQSLINGVVPRNPGALPHLPRVMRLALEMSLHESSEQKALEEDLSLLERDWREAEEIAAIADNLLPRA